MKERRKSGRAKKALAHKKTDWPDQLFGVLKNADIRQVGYVPDAGHARLIERCRADNAIRDVALTSEEEGVALAAGAWLGHERSVLLMQSSGVGNCINMLSLTRACRFPLVMLVTMRGEWAEFNPWQAPMGLIVEPVLKLADMRVYRVERAEDVAETVQAAIELAFDGDLAVAVLLSQRMIGRKAWTQ
jgi:sulfopyruvate decarboxylase alpha subunit